MARRLRRALAVVSARVKRGQETELEAELERAGVVQPLRERLAVYGYILLEANRRVNLTGAKTPSEVAAHLLDSLTVAPYVREPYVDVGSGGGLPAIPVALATGVPMTLVEATAKKARFLEASLARLGLRGQVLVERAEAAGHEESLRERFASGTGRALAAAPTVAELLLPLIALGGVAILQRGRLDRRERTALEDAALMLGGEMEAEVALGGERRILVLQKSRATPTRFPRRSGVPEKRPLCFAG